MVGYYHIGSDANNLVLCAYRPLSIRDNFHWKMSWILIPK